MSKSKNGPRKPATKFPHLRKQMQKNIVPQRRPIKPTGRKSGG
jgi:hypothetical protein